MKQRKSSSTTSSPKPILTTETTPKHKPESKPETSAWDRTTYFIKDYLRTNLNDPKSLKIKDAYKVVPAGEDYIQRVTYRAKNGFGALVLEDNVFFMKRVYNKVQKYEVYEVWSYSDFKLLLGN